MNKVHRTKVSCICSCCFFILWSQQYTAQLEYCSPRECGNGPTIRYPFYIPDVELSVCGWPGFELNCSKNGNPIYHTADNDYVVEQIFYNNDSLRVYNAAFSNPSNSCTSELRNMTSLGDQFSFPDAQITFLYLFSNCTAMLPKNLTARRTACANENKGGWELAMFVTDMYLNYTLEVCRSHLTAPVESDGEVLLRNGAVDYEMMLRRGFNLVWSSADTADCRICQDSGGNCSFDAKSYSFQCLCGFEYYLQACPRLYDAFKEHRNNNILWLTMGSCFGAGLLIATLIFYFRKKLLFFCRPKVAKNIDVEALLVNCGSLVPKKYSYSDVKKMTNNFKDKVGQGGYGFVYKGQLQDGKHVAVKILKESKGKGEEFINEVATISRTCHVNVVTLLGFCFQDDMQALIYEFMSNGSLEKFISGEKPSVNQELEWQALYRIAVGIARGLEYLHRGCNTKIVHFDIKPHNILLDEDFSPKISDFGLAKLCLKKESIVSMAVARGTIGYIAPEVIFKRFGGVSHKSDVYSYGMMLSEIVLGGRNSVVDCSSDIYFPNNLYTKLHQGEELGLSGILNKEDNNYARKMLIVSFWCIQSDPKKRPAMTKVLEMLEGNVEALQVPPKPSLSSPSRPLSECLSPTSSINSLPSGE